jgi:hypothetical protein
MRKKENDGDRYLERHYEKGRENEKERESETENEKDRKVHDCTVKNTFLKHSKNPMPNFKATFNGRQ